MENQKDIDPVVRISQLEEDLEKIVRMNADYLSQLKEREEEIEHLKIELQNSSERRKQNKLLNGRYEKKTSSTANRNLQNSYDVDLRNSFSFRLGNMVITAINKPGKNTVMLPFRLIRLFFESLYQRQ